MKRLRRIVSLRNLAFVPLVVVLLDIGPCFRGDQECRIDIPGLGFIFFVDSSFCANGV